MRNKLDKLFNKAAEIIVDSQQGSPALLRRKLRIGTKRSNIIIDQLEEAGIVGPSFEGSLVRHLLIEDYRKTFIEFSNLVKFYKCLLLYGFIGSIFGHVVIKVYCN